MKKLILLLIVAMPLFSMAQKEVKSFEDIMTSLEEGKTVSAVFYYKDCQLISDNEIDEESVDAIGGMEIDTWEYFAEGAVRNKIAFVVSSTSKLIANPLGEGYVYNYAKIKIDAEGKVKITANYVDSVTHEEIMTKNFFTTIFNGEEGSAHFYIK